MVKDFVSVKTVPTKYITLGDTGKIHSDAYETFAHKRRAKRETGTWCYVYKLKAQDPLILKYFREL